MFESRDLVKNFLKYMNSRHLNIQFTCEEESSNKIGFLYISITKINNKLTTSLYRKKTLSVVYLNFSSFLTMDYKNVLIHNLLDKLFIKQDISGAVSNKEEVFICLEFLGKIFLQIKKAVN